MRKNIGNLEFHRETRTTRSTNVTKLLTLLQNFTSYETQDIWDLQRILSLVLKKSYLSD